jgi:hypothetical protein
MAKKLKYKVGDEIECKGLVNGRAVITALNDSEHSDYNVACISFTPVNRLPRNWSTSIKESDVIKKLPLGTIMREDLDDDCGYRHRFNPDVFIPKKK